MPETSLFAVGIILVFLGIAIILIASSGSKDVKVGFGGFIGPFPFGWANDPAMLKWIMAITAVIAIVFIVFMLKGF